MPTFKIVCNLLLNYECFVYFWIQILCQICVSQTLQILACFFILWTVFFCRTNVLNFNEVQLINFIPFVYYAYAAESKKIIAIAKMIKIFSYIIFKEFYSFVCIFRSVIHFELTFIKGSQSMSGFNLIFECPTGQHH